MIELGQLIERIVDQVNINLREQRFDAGPFLAKLIPPEKLSQFYGFYGLTPDHQLRFFFKNSSLAGSYFLGRCLVEDSVLYKSDIRGDELKRAGEVLRHRGLEIPLHTDEAIEIKNSCLVKTLVHNCSHDPEMPDLFMIHNTASMPYANIHGSPVEGCFIHPFATVDLTTLHDSVVGAFAYVQAGELDHAVVEPGQIWIHGEDEFDFEYQYPASVLSRYIRVKKGEAPKGLLMDFAEARKRDFQEVFNAVRSEPPIPAPKGASLSLYSVVKGKTTLSENVLVTQRCFLDNAWMGPGANAQENCHIVNSRLEGLNVTAHGGKVINADLGRKTFVGFNSLLRGSARRRLKIGADCIVMPHTIIDPVEKIAIPPESLVWGFISTKADLATNTIPLDQLSRVKTKLEQGAMRFTGSGERFVQAFVSRIEHILEANGAYYDGTGPKGHAQKSQHISFNTIQPYPAGPYRGTYPTMDIRP